MTRTLHSTRSILLLALLPTACGTDKGASSAVPLPAGNAFLRCADLARRLPPQRVPFVAGQAGGASAEASTVLYALDLPLGAARPILVRDATSTDPILFHDGRTRSHLLVERWASRPSRLTVFASDGTIRAERSGLPKNTWNFHRTRSGDFLATGWDNGELALLRTSDWSLARNAWRPAGLGPAEQDTHLAGAISDERATWLVSTGYSLRESLATQAKLLQLAPDFSRVEATIDIPSCRNAFGFFTAFPSARSAVLACNPHYYGPEAGSPNPVVVAKLIDGAPSFRSLEKGTDPGLQTFEVSEGASESGSGSVILTARSTQAGNGGWLGRIRRAERVELGTGERVPTTPFAGQVVALRTNEGTAILFSCVFDPSSARCLPKTFGLRFDAQVPPSTTGSTKPTTTTCTLSVDFRNDFVSFAKEIP